jgi:hypothetical protein
MSEPRTEAGRRLLHLLRLADSRMSEPRTEAGRRLLHLLRLADAGPLADTLAADWLGGILAIEAEAAALDVERLARALEAVRDHVGPTETVTFARFAQIVAAEYAA